MSTTSIINQTRLDPLHIAIIGRRNAGKSSLINNLLGQQLSIVSDYKGTTTDPVKKAMEVHGLGPVMLIDTAGIDDEGELGKLRVEKTHKILNESDVILLLFDYSNDGFEYEKEIIKIADKLKRPIIPLLSKADIYGEKSENQAELIKNTIGVKPIIVSDKIKDLSYTLKEIIDGFQTVENKEKKTLLPDIVTKDSLVLLVMPQDIQAPQGRLILPQVQTIRAILDREAIVVAATLDSYESSLKALSREPDLIIADSSVFGAIKGQIPKNSILTSFSILFADYKGDLKSYVDGADAIDKLHNGSKVLIAECCSHAPIGEDIGRVKIPNLLRKRFGEKITFDVVAGKDFVDNKESLGQYDLIIQCGGCMVNRSTILSRIALAKSVNVPITNYGILLAKLHGIFDL